jgi:hypothetical protein
MSKKSNRAGEGVDPWPSVLDGVALGGSTSCTRREDDAHGQCLVFSRVEFDD